MSLIYFPIIISFFSIIFASFIFFQVKKSLPALNKAVEITLAVQEGVTSYIKNQYKTVALSAVVLFFGLLVLSGWKTAIGFLVGVFLCAIPNILGIIILVQADTRVAESAKKGLSSVLDLTIKTGLIMGFFIVGFGLLAISGYYFFIGIDGLIGLVLGVSLVSVFSMVLAGIYKKSADLGIFLFKRNEKITSKDDSKNLISSSNLIAENVESSGVAGEVFQTYVLSLSVSMILGALLFPTSIQFVLLPLIICSISSLALIVGSFFIKINRNNNLVNLKKDNLKKIIYKGIAIIMIFSAVGFYFVFSRLMENQPILPMNLYFSSLIGLAVILGIFLILEYKSYKKNKQAKQSARYSEPERETSLIKSLESRIKSMGLPILIILCGIFFSFQTAGIYGISISAVSMLSVSGIFVTIYIMGSVSKNASEISKISEATEQYQKNINPLELLFKNTTKPIFINYALVSASLSLIVLFFLFSEKVLIGGFSNFILANPIILVGILLGGIIPYLFFSYLIKAIRKTSDKFKKELSTQFRQTSSLTAQEACLGCKKCVIVGLKSTFQEMIFPLLISAVFPIIAGVFLGVEALGGILVGLIVVGTFVLILSALSDEKNSIFYQDSPGLIISPIIKTMSIVALLIVAFLV
jgi:K(+)-stimulated pyrophosphate-energized sodium pump